jgi:dephospho-CoA kinase
MNKTKVLGIAGYMSSGKSVAGKFFENKGFYYIDADKVVDELYEVGAEGWKKIRDYFGPEFLKKDKSVNRVKLAKFVFGDKHKLRILNTLIHPLANNEIRKRMDKCGNDYAVVEAAYFREKHLLDIVDGILWIECDKDVLRKRAIKSGVSAAMFAMIIAVQEKPEKIDYIAENNGKKTDFIRSLESVYREFISGV